MVWRVFVVCISISLVLCAIIWHFLVLFAFVCLLCWWCVVLLIVVSLGCRACMVCCCCVVFVFAIFAIV